MRGSTKIPLMATIAALLSLPERGKPRVEQEPVMMGSGKFRADTHARVMQMQDEFKRRRCKNRVARTSRQRNRRGLA